jgi:hypothetical protein
MSGEPSNFNARAMARWLTSRGRRPAKRQPPGPRPTLADLQRSHCWTWVYCEKCLHHAPMALVPLIIRWGAETSSDRLRRCARCTKCGQKGANLQHPGWAGTRIARIQQEQPSRRTFDARHAVMHGIGTLAVLAY